MSNDRHDRKINAIWAVAQKDTECLKIFAKTLGKLPEHPVKGVQKQNIVNAN